LRRTRGTSSATGSRGVDCTEDRALRLYLEEIGEEQLLTAEEERELAERVRRGDREALERLVKANLRFAVDVAKRYRPSGLSLLDLINQGNLGLIEAAKRFDPDRGFRFITYAIWWVRQSILQAIAEQSGITRLPLEKANMAYKIGRMRRRFGQEHHRDPTVREIALELDVNPRDVQLVQEALGSPISLDGVWAGEGDEELSGRFLDPDASRIDDELSERFLQRDIDSALEVLTPREGRILRLYFGIDGEKVQTLQQIGDELGLTRERVRQIKESAIKKLRRLPEGKRLKAYLN